VEKVDFDALDREFESLHAELSQILSRLIKLSNRARQLQELEGEVRSYCKYIENTIGDAKLLLKQFK
jgi:uncharacterized protein involved in exopolysaccharide biosynthesis